MQLILGVCQAKFGLWLDWKKVWVWKLCWIYNDSAIFLKDWKWDWESQIQLISYYKKQLCKIDTVNFIGQRSTKRFFDHSQSMAEHAFRQHKCDCRVFFSYNEVQYNNIFGKSKFCFQKFRQKPNETFVAWWWSLWKYVCKHESWYWLQKSRKSSSCRQ